MHQLEFLLCESVCARVLCSGSKCVGVMLEENGTKVCVARLSVSKEDGICDLWPKSLLTFPPVFFFSP